MGIATSPLVAYSLGVPAYLQNLNSIINRTNGLPIKYNGFSTPLTGSSVSTNSNVQIIVDYQSPHYF